MRLNKAAMFGLDARIALAIFGALSVISGVALYSAIQKAKVISYITQLKEIEKSIESYMLDTGQDIPLRSGSNYLVNQRELIISSVAGWNGPYFDNGKFIVKAPLDISVFSSPIEGSTILIDIIDDAKEPTAANVECTTSSVSCSYWIRYVLISKQQADSIDKEIDGNISATTGNVRSYANGAKYDIIVKSVRTLSIQ